MMEGFKELSIHQELVDYYRKRGDMGVESASDLTHIKVTDYRGQTPIGWIIPNRFYYELNGEIVDPIHECTISPAQLITLLGNGKDGRPATIGENPNINVIYINIGHWGGKYFTLTGLDDATEIMTSIYYDHESISQVFLKQIKPEYRTAMIKARSEEIESPRRHSRYYERIVIALPRDLESHNRLLKLMADFYKKRNERMQECIRYLNAAEVLRKQCAALGNLAKLADCTIDTKSDPFHVILETPEGNAMKLRYSDGMLKDLVDKLNQPAHKKLEDMNGTPTN